MEGSVCSQFDTAQLKPKHFCAGNRASGLSPCFKLRRIRDTVKNIFVNLEESETQSKNMI